MIVQKEWDWPRVCLFMGKKKVVCINGQRYHSYYQKQNLDVLLLENKLPFASLPLGCGHSGVNQAAQVSRNVESALQVEHFLFQIPFIPRWQFTSGTILKNKYKWFKKVFIKYALWQNMKNLHKFINFQILAAIWARSKKATNLGLLKNRQLMYNVLLVQFTIAPFRTAAQGYSILFWTKQIFQFYFDYLQLQ